MKLLKTKERVAESKLTWNTTINGAARSYAVTTYDSINPDSNTPPVLNLNGIGEGSYSAAVAPAILGANVISPILPFRGELELTPVNIERIAAEVPELVAIEGLKKINASRIGGNSFTSMDMIARSQGGAPGIRAVSENKDLFNKLALVMPFGLNSEQLGIAIKARRARILCRLALASAKSNPFDYGNFRSSTEVSSFMLGSLLRGDLLNDLDAALSFDLVDEVKELADSKDVAVFIGTSDPLFKPSELSRNLSDSNVAIMRVSGGHATVGSRRGREQLKIAYNWLQSDS